MDWSVPRFNVPEYMIKGGVTYRLITDQLGSVRLVVKASDGTVAQRIDFDEFGIATITPTGAEYFQPFGFAGGLCDPDTKLSRFGARDYDPETGRWTSKDPIGFGGGDANLYGYVLADAINSVDPLGLSELFISNSRAVLKLSSGESIELEVGNTTANPRGDPNTPGSNGPAPNGSFPVRRPIYYDPGTEGYNTFGPAQFPLGDCGGNDRPADIMCQRLIGFHGGTNNTTRNTLGCFRFSNKDMEFLVLIDAIDPITRLTNKSSRAFPGQTSYLGD